MDNNSKLSNSVNCTANVEGSEYVLFVILNVISGCFATSGNTMVLLAVYKVQSLRTVSNFFICSLSMADFLVGLLINPLYIAVVTLRVWVSDHPLYRAENYLWIQSLTLSTFSLAAISVDRYIAVTKVFRYQEILTERRCAVIIIMTWAFSLMFASTALVIHPDDASKLWVACVVITVCIPLVIMGYCYFYIFKAAQMQWKSLRRVTDSSRRTNWDDVRESINNEKAAMSVAIIIGLFVILFIPNFVFSVVEISTKEHCRKLSIYRIWLWAIWLAFGSSGCNPWVYALRSQKYREAFKKSCSACNFQTSTETDITITGYRNSSNTPCPCISTFPQTMQLEIIAPME